MKNLRILTMALTAVISISFIACNDDETDWGKDTQYILPISIKDTAKNNYLFLRYGTEGSDTTRIVEYTETFNVSMGVHSRTKTITYNNVGQVISLTEGLFPLYKYEIQPTPRAAGIQYTTIVKKNSIGDIIAYIKINSNNQIISYTDSSEGPDKGKVTTYTYSDKNIDSQTEAKDSQTTRTTTYSYSKYNGIFRNVTTPQWFLVTEFDKYYSSENIHDAISKVSDNQTAIKLEQTFTYKANVKGFPSIFWVKTPSINEETGAIGSETIEFSVTYNVAK